MQEKKRVNTIISVFLFKISHWIFQNKTEEKVMFSMRRKKPIYDDHRFIVFIILIWNKAEKIWNKERTREKNKSKDLQSIAKLLYHFFYFFSPCIVRMCRMIFLCNEHYFALYFVEQCEKRKKKWFFRLFPNWSHYFCFNIVASRSLSPMCLSCRFNSAHTHKTAEHRHMAFGITISHGPLNGLK